MVRTAGQGGRPGGRVRNPVTRRPSLASKLIESRRCIGTLSKPEYLLRCLLTVLVVRPKVT